MLEGKRREVWRRAVCHGYYESVMSTGVPSSLRGSPWGILHERVQILDEEHLHEFHIAGHHSTGHTLLGADKVEFCYVEAAQHPDGS